MLNMYVDCLVLSFRTHAAFILRTMGTEAAADVLMEGKLLYIM